MPIRCGATVLLACILVFWLALALSGRLAFDDAYMFHRYARHLGEGLGLAWNPDGVPTYGLTSQLWVFVVLPFTRMPLEPGAALQVASWLTGIAGLALVRFTVIRHAGGAPRSGPIADAGLLVLAVLPGFATHLTTGMDTMLAFLANAALVLALLDYLAAPALRRAVVVGLAGFIAFLCRPDNGLCALGCPFLGFLMLGDRARRADLIGLVALPVLLILLDLALCRAYFGVPLPLGFYAKSAGGYLGFRNDETAIGYLIAALPCALPFLALALVSPRRRLFAALLIPVGATLLYLLTVRQIMGWSGRYYVPFLPFLVVPALLAAAQAPPGLGQRVRPALAGLCAGFAVLFGAWTLLEPAYLRRILPEPVAQPDLPVAARAPLPPVSWEQGIERFAQDVAARLPDGAVIAASEVGYLGVAAPGATIVDLVGLNDTRTGREGFSMEALLARRPDLIWLPHPHYTGLRARILEDARFHAEYRLIVGAFGYGLAFRRDTPRAGAVARIVAQAWDRLYPGRNLADHVAHRGVAQASEVR